MEPVATKYTNNKKAVKENKIKIGLRKTCFFLFGFVLFVQFVNFTFENYNF